MERSAEVQHELRQLLDGLRTESAAGFARALEGLARQQRMLAHLSKSIGRVPGDVVDRLRAEQERARSEADKEYDRLYREAVTRELDHVELFGVDQLSAESQSQRLTRAYVSLSLTGTDGKDQAGPAPAAQVFDTLTPGAGRLLIRGEAGYGKTTLLQWAAIEAAELRPPQSAVTVAIDFSDLHDALLPAGSNVDEAARKLHELQHAMRRLPLHRPWRLRLPFFIRIRDCKGGKLPKLEEFPFQVASLTKEPPPDWTHRVLAQGLGLVLIDGVDETPPSYRNVVRRDVKKLVEQYPDSLFLVTTRPTAVELDWLADLGFREAVVDPLTNDAREALIDAWHEAVKQDLAQRGRSEDTPALAKALKDQLRDNPPIALLARTPLLAAMICALHRDRRQHLPRKQRELVDALCQMMLYRREFDSGLELEGFPQAYRDLDYEQRRAMLQRLAVQMVRKGASTISQQRAKSLIGEELKSIPARKAGESDEVYTALVERSGMLRETRRAELDFIHNTFKEYLAARQLVRENDLETLLAQTETGEWDNVLMFAAATTERDDFATELIRGVLPREPGTRKTARRRKPTARDIAVHRRRVLAIRLGAVAGRLEPELEGQLKRLEREVFPPRTLADAAVLAAIGPGVLKYLRFQPSVGVLRKRACVRALRLLETPEALEELKQYKDQSDWRIVEELAQAINPLVIPEIQRHVQLEFDSDRWYEEGAVRSRITDLTPLARLTGLTSLDLGSTQVSDLTPLARLTALTTLNVNGTQVSDLTPLAGLTNLTRLELSGTQVSDLTPLAGLSALQSLDLGWCRRLSALTPLARLTGLTTLNLSGTQVSDLTTLAGLTGLTILSLWHAAVSDVTPLGGLTGLRTLNLWNTRVSDLTPLAGLTGLTKLYLELTQVSDLTPLARLSRLQDLYVDEAIDTTPLENLPNLTIHRG